MDSIAWIEKITNAVIALMGGGPTAAIAIGSVLIITPIVIWILYRQAKKMYHDYKVSTARKVEDEKRKSDFTEVVKDNQGKSSQILSDQQKLEDKVKETKEARKKLRASKKKNMCKDCK